MKHVVLLLFSFLTIAAYGQDKYNFVHFNKLREVAGTPYVIATIEHWGKMAERKHHYLLFIDTRNGQARQVNFPNDALLWEMEQIRLDTLQVNKILIQARVVNLDRSKRVDWSDPFSLIVLSADGQEKAQITPDKLYVRTWTVNRETGRLVITGHYDTNDNGKYDKTDKNEIIIYDLKAMKEVAKI